MRYDRETVCIDFDGVIMQPPIEGWQGRYVFGLPVPGVWVFLKNLAEMYRVVVLTARPDIAEVQAWFATFGGWEYIDEITNTKPAAKCYIDDKALRFDGDFKNLIENVRDYAPYWTIK